jgi:hypothetical protein
LARARSCGRLYLPGPTGSKKITYLGTVEDSGV